MKIEKIIIMFIEIMSSKYREYKKQNSSERIIDYQECLEEILDFFNILLEKEQK